MVIGAVEKKYQSYYTNSDSIVTYMMKMLAVRGEMKILEPCAGDGIFVDALLNEPPTSIDAFELNPQATEILKQKYAKLNNVSVICGDTLTNEKLRFAASFGGVYDRIIANPPYGAWQDYDHRKVLKKIYPELYVKETYSLFLYAAIKLLRADGILVFIIPDTWLNLHTHTRLRSYLLQNTKILEIALFPTSFFPNVNFGYANLCIITLQKCLKVDECLNNKFNVFTDFKKPEQLLGNKAYLKSFAFNQKTVLNNVDSALFISSDESMNFLINNAELKVGDIADCVTGFYSGNDKKHLRATSDKVKNSKRYCKLLPESVCRNYSEQLSILEGIDNKKCFIPIVKGGNVKYLKPDNWFIDWSRNAVNEYKIDSKARFQNSRFYFKTGIGVPMVSSSQITASLIENKIFDQSIVGVFPRETHLTYFLLAFFNTDVCNRIIRTINPSANNPANYIKKIPFIKPSNNLLTKVNSLVKNILDELRDKGNYNLSFEQELNFLFEELYEF